MKRPEGIGGGKWPQYPTGIDETGTKEKSRSGQTNNVRQEKNKQGGRLHVVRRPMKFPTGLESRTVTQEQRQTPQKGPYRQAVTVFIRAVKTGKAQDCMNGLANLEKLDPGLTSNDKKAVGRLREAFQGALGQLSLKERNDLSKGITQALMGVKGKEKNDARLIETLIVVGKQLNLKGHKVVFDLGVVLLKAAKLNPSFTLIDSLVSKGAKVNQPDEYGSTPLHWACENGASVEVVQYLISKGVKVNQPNKGGWTPLHYACANGASLEVVKLLISKGANIHQKNDESETPLHYACENGAPLEVVQLLISKGAKVNQPGKFGFTPLHVACENARPWKSLSSSSARAPISIRKMTKARRRCTRHVQKAPPGHR